MAYEAGSGTVIMHGGAISQPSLVYLVDTWAWDGATWQQRTSNGTPSSRDWHSLAYAPESGGIIRFGGLFTPPTQSFATLFSLSAGGWSQINTAIAPLSRGTQAMAYDNRAHRTLMFGGLNIGVGILGDTWELRGTTWRQLATTGPAPRVHCALAFDEARNQFVLFGGGGSQGGLRDTWVWTECHADFNCDGVVDFFDYLDFVDVFSSSASAADFNGDGTIDFFDYLDFVDQFSTGC